MDVYNKEYSALQKIAPPRAPHRRRHSGRGSSDDYSRVQKSAPTADDNGGAQVTI